jgi:hypothetical protein
MKTRLALPLLISVFSLQPFSSSALHAAPAAYKAFEIDVGIPTGQFRAAPINLGGGQRGLAVVFGQDPNVDPAESSFFFPRHKPILAVFTLDGCELWRRELPNAIPGVWFVPLLPFDMDRDGADELYYVDNIGEKPFVYKNFRLTRADACSGKVTGQWPWLIPTHNQASSYKWRFSLIGGYASDGAPVLVSAQGCYHDMRLVARNSDMTKRWENFYPDAPDDASFDGPRSSHSNALLDLDRNPARRGAAQFMWGERCIDFDDGRERITLDHGEWNNHSDTVLPIYDRATGQWNFWTVREKGSDGKRPRAVMFNQAGDKMWAVPEKTGHFHYGWVGNMGANGERIALAGCYVTSKDAGNPDIFKTGGKSDAICKFYEAKTGKRIPTPKFPPIGQILDFNGDGIHEIFFQGALYDHRGEKVLDLGDTHGVIYKHILPDLPGEHLMVHTSGGKLQIWADRNAKDTPEMAARYKDPMYYENVRHSAVGYNNRFPILNY